MENDKLRLRPSDSRMFKITWIIRLTPSKQLKSQSSRLFAASLYQCTQSAIKAPKFAYI